MLELCKQVFCGNMYVDFRQGSLGYFGFLYVNGKIKYWTARRLLCTTEIFAGSRIALAGPSNR